MTFVAKSKCTILLQVRLAAVVAGLVVSVICGRLVVDNGIQLYRLTATNMSGVELQPSSVFEIKYVPLTLMLISTICTAIPLLVQCCQKRPGDELEEARQIRLAERLVLFRWLDWAITVPLMVALISSLSGVRDEALVLTQAVLALVTIITGVQADMSSGIAWVVAMVLGSVTMLTFWSIVFWHLSHTEAPGFVYAIVVAQTVLFVVYPAIALIKTRRLWSTEKTESVYAGLGVFTKSVLVFILAFGARVK